MKKNTHCPLCYEELTTVETTPCISCGQSEISLKILKQDINESFSHDSVTYSNYRAFEEIEIILCNLCTFDFSSVNPEFFGLENNKTIFPSNFQFLTEVENPEIGKDKYCSSCNMRLAYLLFVKQIRELNTEGKAKL